MALLPRAIGSVQAHPRKGSARNATPYFNLHASGGSAHTHCRLSIEAYGFRKERYRPDMTCTGAVASESSAGIVGNILNPTIPIVNLLVPSKNRRSDCSTRKLLCHSPSDHRQEAGAKRSLFQCRMRGEAAESIARQQAASEEPSATTLKCRSDDHCREPIIFSSPLQV